MDAEIIMDINQVGGSIMHCVSVGCVSVLADGRIQSWESCLLRGRMGQEPSVSTLDSSEGEQERTS